MGRFARIAATPAIVEFGVPACLALFVLGSLPLVNHLSPADRAPDALAAGLAGLAALSCAGRRRWPVPTLGAVTLLTTTYLLVGYPFGPILLCVALAVYSVARRRPPAPAALWCVAAFAALTPHVFVHASALPGLVGLIPASAWVAVPFTAGVARRAVLEARARERHEAERRLVDAERLRLAQEVHDVVGHGLAAINMQASIALHVASKSPAQAALALAAISRASADALAELRATLAAITPAEAHAARPPAPGLARLDDLRRRVEDAGVAVEITTRGRPRPLPNAVDTAAYRVLQEALTNVVKHSAHPRAAVGLEYGKGALTLTVINQDLAPEHTVGFGINGMRRRVEHLGGQLTAGPGEGTFEVRASLPTGAGAVR
ncbi:two-component sensor histidine kinase [Virgisporangium aliadipatigenens]|uniref:histidine kinase n=1 Tax=Virgisporangium aliadipatigenens TaxID=741659 RepID=A0A8J4DQ59_9ACTN|nr:histidine kinase [Virgisporangium aliadipatigenens]GIJ45087.1 two-component sensor histidine kinase [Virgisporangium aliadipatigenens]